MSDSEEQTTSKRTRDRQKRKLADNEYTTDTDSSPDETSPKTPRLVSLMSGVFIRFSFPSLLLQVH